MNVMSNAYVLVSAYPGHMDDPGHMDGYGWGGGWMWLWGPLMMVFWLVVLGVAAWLVVRATTNRGGTGQGSDPNRQAREILAQRYAKGEIGTEEYEERLAKLR
jgi:putative membrane protein